MIGVLRIVGALLGALAIGVVVQVLFAQAGERGSFGERIGSVLEKQFGFAEVAPPPAPVADAASARSFEEGPRLSPEYEAAVRVAADRYAAATRDEIARLKYELQRESEFRDRDGFWTDVRLNTLFMLLGLGVPVLLRRFGMRVG
jgi:hypothetical protein